MFNRTRTYATTKGATHTRKEKYEKSIMLEFAGPTVYHAADRTSRLELG